MGSNRNKNWRRGWRKILSGLAIAGAATTGNVGFAPSGWARDVNYSIDDGTAERAIGIDPGEDTLWFNTFPVAAGGEVIDSISVAFGRPGLGQALNGLNIIVLLYEDLDGGDPWNATLETQLNAVTANANTNTLNVYHITPTEVHGTMLAAVIFRNTTTTNRFISASDETAPTLSNRSFFAFTIDDMNQNDLSSIPVSQRGPLESILPGNWLLRAHGVPLPEPTCASASIGAILMCSTRRRPV